MGLLQAKGLPQESIENPQNVIHHVVLFTNTSLSWFEKFCSGLVLQVSANCDVHFFLAALFIVEYKFGKTHWQISCLVGRWREGTNFRINSFFILKKNSLVHSGAEVYPTT